MCIRDRLGADCILIANDDVMNDAMRKTTIKLAKPSGVKLVIKTLADAIEALNSGVTDKYKLFIVVESIEDAYQIATQCPAVKAVNLGGDVYKRQISMLRRERLFPLLMRSC